VLFVSLIPTAGDTTDTPVDGDEDSGMGDAMAQLGIYDPQEETGSWSFDEIYTDS
jgi:hypothetical protein